MKWEEDKIKHLLYGFLYGFGFNLLITILFLSANYTKYAYSGVSDALTLITGLMLIFGWEFLPKWFPDKFPNRTFDINDIYAGLIGLGVSLLLFKLMFVLLEMVIVL